MLPTGSVRADVHPAAATGAVASAINSARYRCAIAKVDELRPPPVSALSTDMPMRSPIFAPCVSAETSSAGEPRLRRSGAADTFHVEPQLHRDDLSGVCSESAPRGAKG